MTNAIAPVVVREGEVDRVAVLEGRVEALMGSLERLVGIVEHLVEMQAQDRATITRAELARVLETCTAGIDDGR